ncbi:hypothetical protein TSUD_04150 [Trifolium subterraneum]|nr:hypothetical protein TSUD_04150 [Trifolium subterraneum]
MGWLSRIFKGSDHNVSEGHYYKDDSNYYLPSTSGDVWAENENEDIDRAIALSLAEDTPKAKKVKDHKSQLEEDEQLARAIEESLNLESPPKHGNDNNNNMYQPIQYFPMGYRICAGCNTEIGYGRYLNCLGAFWHPECFRCRACNLPISDYEFSTSGNYPYHKACYKESYHPKCDVCRHFIPTNPAGLIEYRAHPFWNQHYCPSHEHDNTPRCCSCERMEPEGTGYIALKDGRKLCLECLDSSIMDTNECQPLHADILKFYESINMRLDQQVPLLLVERQALNEAREGEKNISRRPYKGMRSQPYKVTARCDVTAILILYGLPRLLTGSILAHEMMHAWLRLSGFRTLSQDVEEGICQVLAHMWLESELSSASGSNFVSGSSSSASYTSKKGKRPPFEKKLGEFFKHQIESDISPVYGDGFRAGQKAVRKYGLQRTLHHIKMTGSFPYEV